MYQIQDDLIGSFGFSPLLLKCCEVLSCRPRNVVQGSLTIVKMVALFLFKYGFGFTYDKNLHLIDVRCTSHYVLMDRNAKVRLVLLLSNACSNPSILQLHSPAWFSVSEVLIASSSYRLHVLSSKCQMMKCRLSEAGCPHAPKPHPAFFLCNTGLGLSVYMSLVFGYLIAMEPVHYSAPPKPQYPYHICPLRLMLLSEI